MRTVYDYSPLDRVNANGIEIFCVLRRTDRLGVAIDTSLRGSNFTDSVPTISCDNLGVKQFAGAVGRPCGPRVPSGKTVGLA